MKITMPRALLNEIYDVCGPTVLGKANSSEPMCSHILLSVGQTESTAVAANSFVLTKLLINNENLSGDDGDYLLPIVKPPKWVNFVTLENTEDNITIAFDNDEGTRITQGRPYGSFINWEKLIPERENSYEIGVAPKAMSIVMKELGKATHIVKMAFGEKATDPILLTTPKDNVTIMLMPSRLKSKD